VLRKISFVGLLLSSTWLIIPVLPNNLEKTRASIDNLSRSEFNIEDKTLELVNIEKSVPVEYINDVENSPENKNTKPSTIDTQLALMEASQKTNTNIVSGKADHQKKVNAVYRFLSRWGGPAKYYAEDFVAASEKYGIDYRLVASISIVESGGCKHTFRPYNCWGWGKKTFRSYEEGIYTVTQGLATKYIARGLKTPSQMGRVYAPPSKTWGAKVSSLMSQMPKL
jgi:hypothetical protein